MMWQRSSSCLFMPPWNRTFLHTQLRFTHTASIYSHSFDLLTQLRLASYRDSICSLHRLNFLLTQNFTWSNSKLEATLSMKPTKHQKASTSFFITNRSGERRSDIPWEVDILVTLVYWTVDLEGSKVNLMVIIVQCSLYA